MFQIRSNITIASMKDWAIWHFKSLISRDYFIKDNFKELKRSAENTCLSINQDVPLTTCITVWIPEMGLPLSTLLRISTEINDKLINNCFRFIDTLINCFSFLNSILFLSIFCAFFIVIKLFYFLSPIYSYK